MAKNYDGWCIKDAGPDRGEPFILHNTYHEFRDLAIEKFLIWSFETWKQEYRKGWRCVKVKLTEVEDGK